MDHRVRTGILGGTFDPIHNGHIAIAYTAIKQLCLDEVWFMPNGDPPHKKVKTSIGDRWNMLVLAIEGCCGMRSVDWEMNRSGTVYTADTMSDLKSLFPERDFTYIVGADAYSRIENWKRFEEFPRLFDIAVIARKGGYPYDIHKKAGELKEKYGLISYILNADTDDISSEDIRYRAARHMDISGLVPENVARYIEDSGIYRDARIEILLSSLSPSRWQHTLGVESTAASLAKRYGCDEGKAAEAALFHDCAKSMETPQELIDICQRGHIDLSEDEIGSPEVLHAPAGAVIAREIYGIIDTEVLDAIRWHTTGHAGMTLIEKIVYLADMIEPGRKDFGGLAYLRDIAYKDLDKAIVAAAESTIRYVRSKGITPDRRTTEMINNIINGKDTGGNDQ